MTQSDKIVVSDLKSHELSYNELIKIVHKHTEIPLNLVSLMVGNKKIDQTSVIDLQQNQLINVYTKGFGGTGDQGAILNERICVSCGSKTAFKYLYIKTMNQEKIHVIQTMTKKTLNKDKDCVCHKCERKAGRQLEKSDHQPTKKKRVSDELCFLNKTNMCASVASRNSNLLNIPIFCDFFGIKKENFDPNQSNVALCTKHYHKYYHHINSCKICLSRLQHAAKRKVSPENIELAISYYKTIYPDKNLILTTNDRICSNCYFLIRNLGKSSQSVDPNSDLNSIIKKYTESSYENKMDLAVKKSVIFVAKKFLNNEAVLFPEVLDLYMSPSASDPDDDNSGTNNLDDSDIDNLSNSVSDKLDESVSINEAAFPKCSR